MNLASKKQSEQYKQVAIWLSWLGVMVMTVLAYWPGLSGPFMLDDYGAIAALGKYDGVRDWETFKAYVFGGHSGPTGRPVSLLTFLIDSQNWPADPWPFKRTNLIIHLLNGVLLGTFIAQILHVVRIEARTARRIALVVAACWLLHPFLVSTTLYVVQRMAQLSTLFVFAGLIGYMYGRSLLSRNTVLAYVVMSASLATFTVLATFSKENGALLPLLAGVVEISLFASQDNRLPRLDRRWFGAFIAAPAALIVGYLAMRVTRPDFFEIVPPRDFSIYERLLTQPRVLVEYLQHWFVPKLYTTGVFQDHFIKSITTALAMVLHLGAITLAFYKRRQWPLFSLAILFFYGAHLIESTVLNLELYFEHRNYLSASLLLLPLVVVLNRKLGLRTFVVTCASILFLLGGFTRYSATIWQDMGTMIEVSARKAPTSPRAQGRYATELFNAGRHDEALSVLDRAIASNPTSHSLLYLTRLNILCYTDLLTREEFDALSRKLGNTFYDPRSIALYTVLVDLVAENRCPELSAEALQSMFVGMLAYPFNADPKRLSYSHVKYFIGRTHIFLDNPAAAVEAFEESLASRPGASHAMIMAALLASSEYHREALHISELALSQLDADRQSTIGVNRVSEADIRYFQDVVRADIEAQRGGDISDPVE
jgi:tetratricopeptide (TPR) repeat protein